MFLVDKINRLVTASAPVITVRDTVYQVENANFFKANYILYPFDLKPGYEVGWCTFDGSEYTTIEKPVKPIDAETLQAIADKLEEINAMCEQTIVYGVDYGGGHYTLTKYDQINITTWSNIAKTGKSVPYHADGEDCRMYTSEEFMGLVGAVTLHIVYNQTYANQLKKQTEELIELAEVQAVYYGTALNAERQAKLEDILQKTSAELGIAYEADT